MQPHPPRGANENALGYTQIRFSYFPAPSRRLLFPRDRNFLDVGDQNPLSSLILPPSFTSIFHFFGKDRLKFRQVLSLSRMSSIRLVSHETPRPSPFQGLP